MIDMIEKDVAPQHWPNSNSKVTQRQIPLNRSSFLSTPVPFRAPTTLPTPPTHRAGGIVTRDVGEI